MLFLRIQIKINPMKSAAPSLIILWFHIHLPYSWSIIAQVLRIFSMGRWRIWGHEVFTNFWHTFQSGYAQHKILSPPTFFTLRRPWERTGCNTLTRIDMNWHSPDSLLLAMQCVEVTVALTVHCPIYWQNGFVKICTLQASSKIQEFILNLFSLNTYLPT